MIRRFLTGMVIGIVFHLVIQGVNCSLNHQPKTCWSALPVEIALEIAKKGYK